MELEISRLQDRLEARDGQLQVSASTSEKVLLIIPALILLFSCPWFETQTWVLIILELFASRTKLIWLCILTHNPHIWSSSFWMPIDLLAFSFCFLGWSLKRERSPGCFNFIIFAPYCNLLTWMLQDNFLLFCFRWPNFLVIYCAKLWVVLERWSKQLPAISLGYS